MELGVTIEGIGETRSKDLLVDIKCAAKDRGRLDSAFRGVVCETRSVRHLVPTIELEILGIAEAVRSCLREDASSEMKVSMTRRPFRGTRKTFVTLEKARGLTLLKVTHIKIGWMSCM